MKLIEAIDEVMSVAGYRVFNKVPIAPNEVLKAAAMRCFMYGGRHEVVDKIKAACIHFENYSTIPKE